MKALRYALRSVASLMLVLSIASCARAPNLPTAEMKLAQDAIERAEKGGARRYALSDLQLAEAAYKQAEEAHQSGHEGIAKARASAAATLAARARSLASKGQAPRGAADVRKSETTVKETLSSEHQ